MRRPSAIRWTYTRDLADWLAAHPDAYQVEPRATFAQVYLDPSRHGDGLQADAKRLLEKLSAADPGTAPSGRGDGLVLLESRYADVPRGEVARLFGASFAQTLFEQPVGTWVGPIDSGYGSHLVSTRVQDRARLGAARGRASVGGTGLGEREAQRAGRRLL